jgi:lipopolysaccharide transport system permease protein
MDLLGYSTTTPTAPAEKEYPEIVIRHRKGLIAIDWKELLAFRELLFFLVWRDVKVRYKQTSLGVAWAVLQPLMTMLIFSVIFGKFAKVPSQGELPYPVFVFAGLVPWLFFSSGVATAATSLISQHHLLTKIYFPRLFVPTAAIGAFLVDMLISLALYGVILFCYGIAPSWQVIFLPFLLVVLIAATLGLGFSLAALIVLYRDFRHTVPFMMQVLMFVSPVIYPLDLLLKSRFLAIFALNPMFGIIDGFRSAVLGEPWHPLVLVIGTAVSFFLFVFGLFFFRRTERLFADLA